MTAARSLARVETSLSPTELVLRWLHEAHAHDSFVAYSRAIYALGPGALPLDQLVREARSGAEASRRHRPRETHDETIRATIRQAVFVFHLVMWAIVLAEAKLDREALTCTALSAHLGLVMAGNVPEAARLFRVAEALREVAEAAMSGFEREEYDSAVGWLGEELDRGFLGSAWTEGGGMTADSAVAFALSP